MPVVMFILYTLAITTLGRALHINKYLIYNENNKLSTQGTGPVLL